jgi:hypothetical protein
MAIFLNPYMKSFILVFLIALIGACLPAQYAERKMTPIADAKEEGFTDPKLCGGCHSKQYDQWVGSMHHYAQATYPMELVNDFLLKETGKTIGPFCIQCHTPIGTINGEPYGLPNKERTPLSMSGVSCDVCHSMSEEHGASQAFFGLKSGNKDAIVYGPHGKGTKDDPALTKSSFHRSEQRDIFKSSEMCQNCHELMVPNGFRLQETYREWKDSPWAKEGVTCQGCHMSPTPGRPVPRERGFIAEIDSADLPER